VGRPNVGIRALAEPDWRAGAIAFAMLFCLQTCSVSRRWATRWSPPRLRYSTIRRSTRSARWFAPPTKTCRPRSPATGESHRHGKRRHAVAVDHDPRDRLDNAAHRPGELLHAERRQHLRTASASRHAEPAQRLADHQPHAAGREPGVCRARDAAQMSSPCCSAPPSPT